MSYYSDITNIQNKLSLQELIQLLNDEAVPPDEIDLADESSVIATRFNSAAKEAQAIIDSYLSKYVLPFTSVPDRIVSLSDDIIKYLLYKRRNAADIPDSILSIYKECVKTLENIQKGIIALDVELIGANEPAGRGGEYRVNKSRRDHLWGDFIRRKF